MEQYLGTSILSAQLAIIAIPTILLIGFSIMGLMATYVAMDFQQMTAIPVKYYLQ